MRINFIMPAYLWTPAGGYKVVYDHANYLATRGHQVRILFPRATTSAPNGLVRLLRDWRWAARLRRQQRPLVSWHRLDSGVRLLLTSNLQARQVPDADITIATGWQTAGPVAQLPAVKGRLFYFIQGYETWSGDADAVNATWRLPLCKIVISQWLQAVGERLGADRMSYVPNGLDLATFKTDTPPTSRPFSLLTAYHRAEAKGLSDALIALEAYHARYPDIPIAMFGAEPQAEGLPSWITYHSGLSGAALADLYNRYGVYLNASRSEGWALTPAEAMACGCAFVGTDSGGVTDYAVNGETALLSKPQDPEGLFANLIRITEDESLYRCLQAAGHAAIQNFTLERSNKAFEQSLMTEPGRMNP